MESKKQLLLKALGSLSGSAVHPSRLGQLIIGRLTAQELWLRVCFVSGSVMFILEGFAVPGRLKQINKQSRHGCSKKIWGKLTPSCLLCSSDGLQLSHAEAMLQWQGVALRSIGSYCRCKWVYTNAVGCKCCCLSQGRLLRLLNF